MHVHLPTATRAPATPSDTERSPAGQTPAPANHDRPSDLKLPALVFCRSRTRVEGVARELAAALGWDRVGAYHAGMTKEERTAIEEWFFHAEDAVLVATCAYGMGVDKSNIRTCIHYDLPSNVEAFLQESGRAGRDGGRAESVVLFNPAEHHSAATETEMSPEAENSDREERHRQMVRYCSLRSCRRQYLMALLGAESEVCFGCDNCDAERTARLDGAAPDPDTGSAAGSLGAHRPANPLSAHLRATVTEEVTRSRDALLRFIRRNPRLLMPDQVVRLLRGRPQPGDRWAPRRLPQGNSRCGHPGSAALTGWTEDEARELLESVLADGTMRRARLIPWLGRVTLSRAARRGTHRAGPS